MKQPSMFRLTGAPHSFFGETHVLVSVWREGNIWNAEYSVLSTLPAEQLAQRTIEFDVTDYPAELPPVDGDYMEAEALSQAKLALILEMEQRAKDIGRVDLSYLPIELLPERITPVTLWTLGTYPTKFKQMFDKTSSPELRTYLKIVMSMGRLRAGS